MLLDIEGWRRHFENYQRSAWRFETQPTYTMPNEQKDFRSYLAGEQIPDRHNESWHKRVRSMVAAGKIIGRVRTVRQPLTDYQRYQLAWGIPGNIEAGEDIRILDLTNLELDLPSQDFWMLDDTVVVHLNFRPDGTLINVDQQENPNLEQYFRWKDIALAHAVPLSEWDART